MKRKTQNAIFFSFYLWFCLFIFYFLLFLSGCATVIEGAKGVAGISTKSIEDNRKGAITKTFNYSYSICYNKALRVLKNIGTYVYSKDINKKMVAFYVSEDDTTAVGIFFKELDANTTQLEVASASTYAKELIAVRLFPALEKALSTKEEEEKSDEKKQDKESK